MFRSVFGKLWLPSFVAFLAFAPGRWPDDVDFISVQLSPSSSSQLIGTLAPNDDLDRAELISDGLEDAGAAFSAGGLFKGAESFAFHDGFLYTGISGGEIIRLDIGEQDVHKSKWTKVAKIGQDCVWPDEEAKCGRVLGLDFDRNGFMIACDAYNGVYRVDVATGDKQVLVPDSLQVGGLAVKVANSVALPKKGRDDVLYFTSSSSFFSLSDGLFELFSKGTGRLLKHDLTSNTTAVLMKGMNFPNGLALSKEEDYLVVAECGHAKIWKYYLTGPKSGDQEMILSLPGCPDNIKVTPQGTFISGVIMTSDGVKVFKANPLLARFLYRLLRLLQLGLQLVNKAVPITAVQYLANIIGHFEGPSAKLMPKYGLVVEFDGDGKLLRSWHSPQGNFSAICEGFILGNYMYLGSPFNTYISRIALSNEKEAQ